jgi:hypothetical protein
MCLSLAIWETAGVAVSAPEVTLLTDAAQVFAAVPVEERVGLRDDVVAFLREELDPRRREDCEPAIAEIASTDPGQPERMQELLLRLCVRLSAHQR